MHTTQPDHQIAQRLVSGDPSAFTQVHTEHHTAMVQTARAILRDHERALDITQDVLLDLWERPSRFDPDRGSLRAYLTTRTKSRALDVIRSETARTRRELRMRGDDRTTEGVAETVVSRSQADAVRSSLARLKDRERDAISLAYFEGLSYRDVAATLQLPEGTVKSRIRAGLGKLRTELAA